MSLFDYPADQLENLKFRKALLTDCQKDQGLARAVRQRCADDLLWWLNVWGWTHDPRKIDQGQQPVLPFITYRPHQDNALLALEEAFGKRDVCIVKTRGIWGTWVIVALFLHRWLFRRHIALGMVSREERLVDGTQKSLFAKVDFLLERQPNFLLPGGSRAGYFRKELFLLNRVAGCTIEGASTTGNIFRGDRYTAVMIDEYAAFSPEDSEMAYRSSNGATNCRYMISTPLGQTGAFYKASKNPGIQQERWHWRMHPEMSAGEYKDREGKWRSPWYDKECKRLVAPSAIASELDLDFAGSDSPFFPAEMLDKHLQTYARPPIARGRLSHDPFDLKKVKWIEEEKGPVKLWIRLNPGSGRPEPYEQYVLGIDIAAGTGTTPSTFSVVERRTREKVAEFSDARINPERFAELVVACAWYFNEAFCVWENNGTVGGQFSQRIIALGYRNVYYKRDEKGMEHRLAKGVVPGWGASTHDKNLLLSEYRAALSEGTFVNRSVDALEECRFYHYTQNASVEHSQARLSEDPSGAGANHGDLVIADALANKLLGAATELEKPHDQPDLNKPAPFGTWLERRQRAMREAEEKSAWESPRESLNGWQESVETMKGW